MRQATPEQITRYADMLAAIGTEHRLRITQLLLTAHPDGMVAGEIQSELGISASNLSFVSRCIQTSPYGSRSYNVRDR